MMLGAAKELAKYRVVAELAVHFSEPPIERAERRPLMLAPTALIGCLPFHIRKPCVAQENGVVKSVFLLCSEQTRFRVAPSIRLGGTVLGPRSTTNARNVVRP